MSWVNRVWAPVRAAAVILALVGIFSVPALVIRPWLAERIWYHPNETVAWGAAPVLLGTAAWLVFVIGYRASVRIQDTEPLPSLATSRIFPISAAVAGALFLFAWVSFVSMYSRRGRDLGDLYPDLEDATFRPLVVVVPIALGLWLLVAVLRPWLRYVGNRIRTERVDAVVELGGTNAVRVLYRPTLGLGAPLKVTVRGVKPFDIGPGQALGFMAGNGPLALKFQSRGTPMHKAMSAHLDLQQGEGTQIVVCDGLVGRVRARPMQELARFQLAPQPFLGRWTNIGLGGPPKRGQLPSRISHRESAHRHTRRAHVWARLSGAIAVLLAVWLGWWAARALVALPETGPSALTQWLEGATATLFLYGALWFQRRKWQLRMYPWERPVDIGLALAAGATMLFAGTAALVLGVMVALAVHNWGSIWRDRRGATGTTAAQRLAYWRRQPDAVVTWLPGSVARAGSKVGAVRIVAAHPLEGVSVGIDGNGWVPLDDSPVGVRAPVGPLRLVIDGPGADARVEVQVVAGAVVDVEVGLLPLGLQVRAFGTAVSVDVTEPVAGSLRKASRRHGE